MKQYPPYEGDEPYLYFAFAEGDRARAWKIMRILLERGCRVWYCQGPAGSAQNVLRRQERAAGAALTILYLTDNACGDKDTKSNVLVNQKYSRQILCLDPDHADRRLSMGLHENIPHIPLYRMKSSADIENAVIHSDGFSQEVLGDPVNTGSDGVLRRLTALFAVLAAVTFLIAFAGIRYLPQQKELPRDEVTIRDPVILGAVREQAGGGVITQELVMGTTVLRLDDLPQSWDDLSVFPSLKRLLIPQQSLLGEEALPEGDYVIELTGGGME